MDKSYFFVMCNWVLNWVILAHTWVAKYCSRVFHTWAEVSQLTIRVRKASDMDARILNMVSWFYCSQSWNLGLIGILWPVDWERKCWSLWPLNVVSIWESFCCPIWMRLDEEKKLEGDWWFLQSSPRRLSMKFPWLRVEPSLIPC